MSDLTALEREVLEKVTGFSKAEEEVKTLERKRDNEEVALSIHYLYLR